MEITYVLRISCTSDQINAIDSILNCQHSNNNDYNWELILIDNGDESVPPIDYINTFIPLVKNKYQKLEKLGILSEDITIWIYYAYDNQCNLEFHPDEMKQLSDNGIVLCVSCWQANQ